MAKNSAIKRAKAKGKPPKPPKPKHKPGEGVEDAESVTTAVMDSAGEKSSAMQKPIGEYYDGPLTSEMVGKIVAAYRPVCELSDDDREARKRLLKRLTEFNSANLFPPSKRPDEILTELFAEKDHAALSWVVSRSVDRKFRERLSKTMCKLITHGNLFSSDPSLAVITIVNRLLELTIAPPLSGMDAFLKSEVDPRFAQRQLAQIVNQFVPGKNVDKGNVAHWIQEECKRPHFREEWATMYRQKTPHNRAQFKFVMSCLAEFDREMELLCGGNGPLHKDDDFPPSRSVAASYMDSLAARDAGLAASINLVLGFIESIQPMSRFALGTSWGYAWWTMRQDEHERMIGFLEPFIKSRFEAAKRTNAKALEGSELQKQAWGNAWPRLSNCLRTVLTEWPFPPLNLSLPGSKRGMEKHCKPG